MSATSGLARGFGELVPLAEVQAMVLDLVEALPLEAVALDEALGRRLGATVRAPEAVPPFASSAMDGYALRSGDVASAPCALEVIGTLPAGRAYEGVVGPGQALRIMTGAPVPAGADAIVPVEVTHLADGDQHVVVEEAVPPGAHLRPAGSDIAAGAEVLLEGVELGPAQLGVLASLGVSKVPLRRRPVVAVFSTGDEVMGEARVLAPGKIRDSNRPALAAAARSLGARVIDLGVCPDDADRLAATLDEAARLADLVLTSGGVSVGDFDKTRVVLEAASDGRFVSLGVAIKPAKPLAFARVGRSVVLSLPGNPVSALVSFELFARPVLSVLGGVAPGEALPVPLAAVAAEPIRRERDGKVHLVRVEAGIAPDGRLLARPSGPQGSHVLSTMARANALAVVPDGDGVEAGSLVGVLVVAGQRLGVLGAAPLGPAAPAP